MPIDDYERLQIPNGIRLDEESMMEIEIAFDGETVTYRDEEGILQDMSTLCYLDHVLRLFVRQLTDEEGNDLHPEGITPGHVLCHLVQHLHGQYHQVETQNQMGAFAELFAGEDGANPLADIERLSENMVGPRDDTEAGTDVESADDDDDDEGEIIVHGLPNDPQKP
jgi:hypothetical protein